MPSSCSDSKALEDEQESVCKSAENQSELLVCFCQHVLESRSGEEFFAGALNVVVLRPVDAIDLHRSHVRSEPREVYSCRTAFIAFLRTNFKLKNTFRSPGFVRLRNDFPFVFSLNSLLIYQRPLH
jgi:hypothetical protein